MDLEKISSIIKTKRKEKGLTQEELANKINVTEKAISRWETGRGTPDISLLVPLSNVLGIKVSELLNGKEDKKEDENIIEIVDYIDKTKRKKNGHVITIATIIYGILLLLYLWYLRVDYNVSSTTKLTYLGELVYNTFFISSVFLTNRFIANHYYDTIEDRKRLNKISYIMIFVLYLIMLFNMTIFARYLNEYRHNIIPFKTLLGYFTRPDSYNIFFNVIGNIVIMMPIEFLLIEIFGLKDFKKCFLLNVILVLLIETLQFISHTGVFDIDDMILNLIGMGTMFFLTTGKHQFIYKYKYFIISSYFSIIIELFLFYNLSWYSFYSGVPNVVVIFRLIISFIIIEFIVYNLLKSFVKK